jgi:hypothetical protein
MKQNNQSPSKANSTTKDPNTYIEDELSNNKIKKTIIIMINDLKEQT